MYTTSAGNGVDTGTNTAKLTVTQVVYSNVAGEESTVNTDDDTGITIASPILFISGTSFTYPDATVPSGSITQSALAETQTGTTSITVDSYNGLGNEYTHVASTTIKALTGK